ncbi:glycosyltransferase [Leptolyngbya sp. FACHB-17]|uniref:glycosyltransferase n=1 Tax=unclassified Leptolyngbya TaxID=2650499 RepID=UPI001680C112|nr:glycosyltransferase family 4 protein [Leptolyngbya sp. FACHB-17]
MKVLQINYSDLHRGGGGAIAMYRLHQGLQEQGIASQILCKMKTLESSESLEIPQSPRLERQIQRWTQRIGLNDIHRVGSFKIRDLEAYQDADVLHLHIIHSGFFNYLAIPTLTQQKPAILTLHDMWALTGHCAYSYDCTRWQTGCGRCPYPKTAPAVRYDSTHLEWKLKEWVYHHSNLAFVAPSRWMTELAQTSLFNHLPIHYIPHGLDTNLFKPLNAATCKDLLGIPANKRVLLISAADLNDRRKGMDLLIKALQHIPQSLRSEIVLLAMGGRKVGLEKELREFQILQLGYIEHEPLKAVVYSASDLFVFPTRADNSPLVLQESIACGTPTISFNVGGVPDLVRPGITGYLAAAEDAVDLSQGIASLLEDHAVRQKLSQSCRAVALEEYSLTLQAQRHIQLYQQLLGSSLNSSAVLTTTTT